MKGTRRLRIVRVERFSSWHVKKGEGTACGLRPPFNTLLTEGTAAVFCPACRATLGDARVTSGADDLGREDRLHHRVRRYLKVTVTTSGLIDYFEPRAMSACGTLGAGTSSRRDGIVTCLACLAYGER